MNVVSMFLRTVALVCAALLSTSAAAGPSSVAGTMTVAGKVWKVTNVHAFATTVFGAPAVRVVLSDIALTSEVARDANDRGRMAAGDKLDKMREAGTLHGMAITLSAGRSGKKMQSGSNELYDQGIGRMQFSGLDRFEQAASDSATIAGRLSLLPPQKLEGGKTIAYDITFSAPIETGDAAANAPVPARAAVASPVDATPTAAVADTLLTQFQGDTVRIVATVAGADLSIAAIFPRAVKSYLAGDGLPLMLDYQLDTDNNVKTGSTLPAPLQGSDIWAIVILRKPGEGVAQEITLTRNNGGPENGKAIKTDARLQVGGNSVQLLIPLSAMNLRKGQIVRLVVHPFGEPEPAVKTFTLQ